jgi:histidine triad (HIT) family protein
MSMDGAYDPENIFAKMLRGEIPCAKAFEDDVALAFMDLFPQSPGHTLVVPKTPARNFLDLPAAKVGPFLERVQLIARAARKAFAPDGVLITQFNGAAAGQSVFHVHFHVIPRWTDSPLRPHAQAAKADLAELAAQAAQLAAAIKP